MATTKSMKIQAEIDKVKAKISEQQARLKELEQKKLEAENSEIVDIVRGMSISLTELPLLFEKLKDGGTLGQSVPKSQAVMIEEVSMEKQKDQEFAHLEVKRLCGVFGAPLPPVEEKPVDKVKEPPRPYRSREREER